MNGKEWQILVNEKYAGHPVTIFDSTKIHRGWNRPIKAVDLLEEFLRDHATFPYESHSANVISNTMTRPLVFANGRK